MILISGVQYDGKINSCVFLFKTLAVYLLSLDLTFWVYSQCMQTLTHGYTNSKIFYQNKHVKFVSLFKLFVVEQIG